MRVSHYLKQSLPVMALLLGAASSAEAALVTVTYQITASDFVNSNNNPPPPPTSTSVSGTVTFTFDTEIASQMEIDPGSVTGIDITNNDGVTTDHNETNSGVNTSLNLFADTGVFTFGGDTSTVAFMVGISNDFRVQWGIDLNTFEVTSIVEDFSFVTTADAFYTANNTSVELIAASVVPLPASIILFMTGAGLLGLTGLRRKAKPA